jgi:catechol 2,3-dioxygenase-like lactoylglutathione lyase family enzyme
MLIRHCVRSFALLALLLCSVEPLSFAQNVTKPSLDQSVYRHVVQVGWVVKDLDKVIDYWQRLGLKNIRRVGTVDFPDTIYRGRRSPITVKRASTIIGGVEVNWTQPLRGKSAFDEFLKAHGDGVHHLTYATRSAEQLQREVDGFKARGVAIIQEGTWQGSKAPGRYIYLDTAPQGGGLTVELMYNPDASASGPAASAENDYPFNRIVQYAFVVRDVKKVSDYFERLGFGGLAIEHNVSIDKYYRGRAGQFEMDLGWNKFGDVPFEWIQSIKGPSVYDEFLKAHGEGFHHLAFDVKDMDEAVAMLKARGAVVSMGGGWDYPNSQGRFAYLDTEPFGGVTIELLWNKPQGK